MDIIKNKRSLKRFFRKNGINYSFDDDNGCPKPKEYPCIVDIRNPGQTLHFYYLHDLNKWRNQLIKFGNESS